MIIFRLRFSVAFFVFLFLFSSCSPERKLAMQFLRHKEYKGSIMVVQPYALDLINNREINLDSLMLPEGVNLDSLAFQQSKYLNQLSDSVFLENYINSFIQTLKKNGFQVYLPDQLDEFLAVKSPAYIIKFAQVELVEDSYPYRVEEKILKVEYKKTFDLNRVSLHSWFEFEARDTAWNKVFYAENSVMDDFSGEFLSEGLIGSPTFLYQIDSLTILHVYWLAADAGKKYAEYFTNYLMNSYIRKHFNPGQVPLKMFYYDSELKMLFPYDEGFEEISKAK